MKETQRVKPERVSSRGVRSSVSIQLNGHPDAKKMFRSGLPLRDGVGGVNARFRAAPFLLISSDQPSQ
jgi:hypothetical protein